MTDAKTFLGQLVDVIIERPLGSKHPKHGFKYLVNYGFISGTVSPDGEELDVYVLGVSEPLKVFRGQCIAVIHRTNDNDDKLVIVPDGRQMTDDEIRSATYFQEQYFQSEIVRGSSATRPI